MTQTILSAESQVLGKMERRTAHIWRTLHRLWTALQPSEGAPQSLAYDVGETDERRVLRAPDLLAQACSFPAMLNRNL